MWRLLSEPHLFMFNSALLEVSDLTYLSMAFFFFFLIAVHVYGF